MIRMTVRTALLLALVVLAGACRRQHDDVRTVRRIPLPDPVAAGATLAFDSLGRAWIGEPGRVTALDSAGAVVARLDVPGDAAPRFLWMRDSVAVARAGGRLLVLDPAAAKVAVSRAVPAPAARDPRGRWVYTATRIGGVLGMTPGSLETRWGWPDPGSRASAITVSPLGDRVYVALAGDPERSLVPGVEVRDAFSGRLLSTFHRLDAPLTALEARRDGTLIGVDADGGVLRLRHGPAGLLREWRVEPGIGEGAELRVAPAGGRVAVVEPGREARVLHAGTGETVARSDTKPLDVAFDVKGRLWMLYPREIRLVD